MSVNILLFFYFFFRGRGVWGVKFLYDKENDELSVFNLHIYSFTIYK
jgi:hypothetical protein